MSKFSFSLSALINNLLTIRSNEEFSTIPGEDVKATTVRLDPDVKKFCDVQSQKLGVSIQVFISMVLKGVMLETISPVKTELMLMQERFFELFKIHNIPIADIPDFLKDYNITLSVVADSGRLLDAYSANLIKFLSRSFCVDEDWLKGQKNDAVYYSGWRSWYKNEYSFCSDLIEMIKSEDKPRVIIIKNDEYHLDMIDEYDPTLNKDDRVKVIVEGQKTYGNNCQYSYYKNYRAEPWKYVNCRLSLKTIILFCHLTGISIDGYSVDASLFKEIDSDKSLFALYRSKLKQINWEPSDYVDAKEDSSPYHTCKPQNELGEVFNTFLKKRLHDLISKQMLGDIVFGCSVKRNYLNKICSYEQSDGRGISYDDIKSIDQEVALALEEIRNNDKTSEKPIFLGS